MRGIVKCHSHEHADAVGTCVYCGIGLCRTCLARSASGRAVCSQRCAQASGELEAAILLIREKSVGSNRLAGRFCIAAGLVLLGFGLFELAHRPFFRPPSLFLCGTSLVFFGAGVAYLRMVAKRT